jgi:hypothetical protein
MLSCLSAPCKASANVSATAQLRKGKNAKKNILEKKARFMVSDSILFKIFFSFQRNEVSHGALRKLYKL